MAVKGVQPNLVSIASSSHSLTGREVDVSGSVGRLVHQRVWLD